ncbi:putative conserved protein YggE, contains kinase-interacting SIMPL domain [Mariprofundus aestuarium]|uniref:Putative conserved protein YggE, contains kinase-interacting SIMPL domain n=1 Tax=Mariprofundus aestuarium TaxID=1921086 RepID=A0A2K8L429_MARES|nr:SIMPL domain-containing protein [Mariprofundus aestuarium]ATX80591.1 putative conserved protein YggE, contains kinase-interacting SIMPL domain [Mariprofundus aestuarium]
MRYLLMLSLLLFTPALAQAESDQPAGTRINISASAETEIPNDEMVITFRVEKEGKHANEIRQHVNRVSAAIQKRMKSERGVKMKTTDRTMQPVWHHPKNMTRIRTAWRMTQTEQITSSNLDAVPEWLDAIEAEGANLANLQFRVSRNSSLETQALLRLQAIKAFRAKAATIARGVDARSFRIIRLNSSSHTPQPVMYRAEMAMMAKAAEASAPPALSAGEGLVRVTVNGEIEVPFTDFPVAR